MSTTSSSPRKRRTIASSRTANAAALLLAVATLALAPSACRRPARDPLVTYFEGPFRLSVQAPASWRTDQANQSGVWYRYFLGPTAGTQRKAAVSATLLAGLLPGSLDDYAQSYLAGNTVNVAQPEKRPGLTGKSFAFASADGNTRFFLLLLKEDAPPSGRPDRVFGLYCQGDGARFAEYAKVLEEMAASLKLERVADWKEHSVAGGGLALRLPDSWERERRLSAGKKRVEQFTSPALGADKGGQTIHASLTATIEPAPGGLDSYYSSVRQQLGPNFALASHGPWRDGYADVMHVETQMASSHIKRFYLVKDGTGYSLAFEARSDAFLRAEEWFDLIADTLRIGPEVQGR
jgi:hypothetical protein